MFYCDYLSPVENPSLKVADLLKNKGYSFTSREGKKIEEFSELDCLGIVLNENSSSRNCFLGVLYFQEENFGAHGKNWVLKINSLDLVDPAQKIIGFLLDEFHIPILLSHSSR